ncbi:MAG TPA: GNAT family N-acetyltransferase [Clostridia bacterium]|nr:GNAT family N-acetyltransferase [Clostridia bacterium]
MPVTFRPAEEKDIALLLKFIRALAEYEHMLDQVVADEKTLADWLFDKRVAEAFFAMEGETEVGFALYFHNFSTFLGRGGIYLEDLFVLPEHRGKGYGKAILTHLAQIARGRGCGRLEWACLDWNKPSIDFYLSLGAKPMNEWTVYRVSGDALTQLAGEDAKEQTTHWEELS